LLNLEESLDPEILGTGTAKKPTLTPGKRLLERPPVTLPVIVTRALAVHATQYAVLLEYVLE
jgi:hypothetical protein